MIFKYVSVVWYKHTKWFKHNTKSHPSHLIHRAHKRILLPSIVAENLRGKVKYQKHLVMLNCELNNQHVSDYYFGYRETGEYMPFTALLNSDLAKIGVEANGIGLAGLLFIDNVVSDDTKYQIQFTRLYPKPDKRIWLEPLEKNGLFDVTYEYEQISAIIPGKLYRNTFPNTSAYTALSTYKVFSINEILYCTPFGKYEKLFKTKKMQQS